MQSMTAFESRLQNVGFDYRNHALKSNNLILLDYYISIWHNLINSYTFFSLLQ